MRSRGRGEPIAGLDKLGFQKERRTVQAASEQVRIRAAGSIHTSSSTAPLPKRAPLLYRALGKNRRCA